MALNKRRVWNIALAIIKLTAFIGITRLLIYLVVFTGLGAISSEFWSQYDGRGLNEPWYLTSSLAILGVTLFVCYLFLRFVEKKDWWYVRVQKSHAVKLFGVGALFSSMAVILIVLVSSLSGAIRISKDPSAVSRILLHLFLAIIGTFAIVTHEELIIRGYALRSLEYGFNRLTAVLLTALLFGAVHLTNPNISPLGVANIVLMGCLLAWLCVRHESLWLPIGLHFGWNLFFYLFNLPLSGHTRLNPFLQLEHIKYSPWTGTQFGPEDSGIVSILLLAALVAIYALGRKQRSKDKKRVFQKNA